MSQCARSKDGAVTRSTWSNAGKYSRWKRTSRQEDDVLRVVTSGVQHTLGHVLQRVADARVLRLPLVGVHRLSRRGVNEHVLQQRVGLNGVPHLHNRRNADNVREPSTSNCRCT